MTGHGKVYEKIKEKKSGWKDPQKAFPDLGCDCLHRGIIPIRCSKCGADRTKDNWISNQSLTPDEEVRSLHKKKELVILRCRGCGERYEMPADEFDDEDEVECDNCHHDLTEEHRLTVEE